MFEDRKTTAVAVLPRIGRDRRIHPRYSFTAAVEALDSRSRSRMNARMADLSSGGCYVDTFCPFPRKGDVTIRITRDKESLVAQANVAFSQIGMGMGLSFTKLDHPDRAMLAKWLAEFSGEPAPDHAASRDAGPDPDSHLPGPDASFVLGELIIALMRKGSLTKAEGNALLTKLTQPHLVP